MKKFYIGLATALILWFYMFSPWTSGISNFWVNMSISALILTSISFWGLGTRKLSLKGIDIKEITLQLVLGVCIAFALWGVFWIGDKLSQLMFNFARSQVNDVYGMKDGTSPVLIAVLLLFVIGPAEEFFWRGFIQKRMGEKLGATVAMFVTTAIYALAHIWSFNFMLVMAALVAGAVWGFLYRLRPQLLPALIISHALWDALVFVILPI